MALGADLFASLHLGFLGGDDLTGPHCGDDLAAALCEGFRTNDFASVVPHLVSANAPPWLAAATRSALVTACDSGQADVARLLLQADGITAADANAESRFRPTDSDGEPFPCDSYTLLAAAADHGMDGVVQALVESGKADVNRGDSLALVGAAGSGDVACLKALLAVPGIDVNKPDADGNGALAIAAHFGATNCAVALLAAPGEHSTT